MRLISTKESGLSCKIGDVFEIEGINKTVTDISNLYVYFDIGKKMHFKSFNALVRQCKTLAQNPDGREKNILKDKVERLETYQGKQDIAIEQYRTLTKDLINDADRVKNSNYPIQLRYILIQDYDTKESEFIFAHKQTMHSDMEKEYRDNHSDERIRIGKKHLSISGGFYTWSDHTLILYGESGTYGRLKKDDLREEIKEKILIDSDYFHVKKVIVK